MPRKKEDEEIEQQMRLIRHFQRHYNAWQIDKSPLLVLHSSTNYSPQYIDAVLKTHLIVANRTKYIYVMVACIRSVE